MKKSTSEKNLNTAYELQRIVEAWVDRTFNFIQLEVYEKMADGQLFEYIVEPEIDIDEFINSYGFEPSVEEFKLETKEEKIIYFEENHSHDLQRWKDERRGENYPMWNTLFEFKRENATEEEILKAQEVGLGIIQGLEPFNTTLFAMSAGHSFYSSYWIPLYLSFYPSEAKKYKGVDYGMM